METKPNQASERKRERELLYNERTFEHATYGMVTIRRPTPEEEFLIEDAYTMQWNEDMANGKYKFREELERQYLDRGIWSPAIQERIEDLTRKTGEAMGLLDALGFKSFEELVAEYDANVVLLRKEFPEDATELQDAVSRYIDLDTKPQFADRSKIEEEAPTTNGTVLLDLIDSLRTQIEVLNEMFKVRKELMDLQGKQTRMFSGCIEHRAERAREIARLHFCTFKEKSDDRLFSDAKLLWRARPEDVELLALEMSYFVHGIGDEFRKSLGKYGFTRRLTDTNASSDDSPAQPPSNSGGESQESEPTNSSEASA